MITPRVGKNVGKQAICCSAALANLESIPFGLTIPFLGVHPKAIHRCVHTHTLH